MVHQSGLELFSPISPCVRSAAVSYGAASPLLIRMYPLVGRDLPRLGQLDHVDRRSVATLPTGPTFERRFQLPQRRVAWPADGIQRQARARLAPIALHFQPAETAVEALADGRRGLRRATIALHPQRPCRARASARSASRAAFLASSRACLARISAPMIWPPQMTSRDLVPMAGH
jgi:hypothetical protein